MGQFILSKNVTVRRVLDEIFLCGKTKENNNDMEFKAYQKPTTSDSRSKCYCSNLQKTFYLYLSTRNSVSSFFAPLYKQNPFLFVFNLWSFQQTAQNKPLHYPLKSKLLPYWCTFSIIHSSIYLICYDIQKMKLSFNEQHPTTQKKRVLTHGIVLIYENPQKEGYI